MRLQFAAKYVTNYVGPSRIAEVCEIECVEKKAEVVRVISLTLSSKKLQKRLIFAPGLINFCFIIASNLTNFGVTFD